MFIKLTLSPSNETVLVNMYSIQCVKPFTVQKLPNNNETTGSIICFNDSHGALFVHETLGQIEQYLRECLL